MAGGIDPSLGDYDKRTALHLSASEGLLEVVRFLVDEAGAHHSPVDRWNGTPLDDAIRHGHKGVKAFLETKGAQRGPASSGQPKSSSSVCVLL